MISPNEFRLGVMLENFLGEAFECNIETMRSAVLGEWGEFGPPKAIPLTPDWLERLGFNEYLKDGRFVLTPFTTVINIQDQVCVFLYATHVEEVCYELPYIKHVHQLQNLYFALTGEELKIKGDN